MKCVIVPDALREAIYSAIDSAIAKHSGAALDRELFYEQLLSFFDEHGYLPDFDLERKHA